MLFAHRIHSMTRGALVLAILQCLVACGPIPLPPQVTERAEEGDAGAQFDVALQAAERNDVAEAIRWYEAAAKQGHPGAQNNLGVIYGRGEGIPQDYNVAVKWYWLGATQGNALAQRNLGSMYESGRGVEVNRVLAHMWYNLAAASGDKDAAGLRQELERRMRREGREKEIAEAQALARKWTKREFSEDLVSEAELIAGLRKAPQQE